MKLGSAGWLPRWCAEPGTEQKQLTLGSTFSSVQNDAASTVCKGLWPLAVGFEGNILPPWVGCGFDVCGGVFESAAQAPQAAKIETKGLHLHYRAG